MSKIIEVDDQNAIAAAVAVLREGELVAFPTDTVYGVAAHAFMPAAVEKLYAAKVRPRDMAIPLLLADVTGIAEIVTEVSPAAQRLIARFLPGALTLVLPRRDIVPNIVCAGGATVAVRIPAHEFVRALIARLGAPLAATSANLSGQPVATTAQEVHASLGERVALVIAGEVSAVNIASTVVDLTVASPRILRVGAISEAEIREALR